MEDNIKISLAPIQGYTDWIYRRAFQEYIGGVDEFYTPFLVLQNDGTIRKSHQREVEPYIEKSINLVPQFVAGTISEFKYFEDYFSELGYVKMNWNLGCPYPMITKRGRGSGLLPYPEKIRDLLDNAYSSKLALSIKLRLGLIDPKEIFSVLDVLKDFNLDDLILHPRTAKQMYKGDIDRNIYEQCVNSYKKEIAYNGDIAFEDDYKELILRFPNLSHVMIGRGILNDLYLPKKIKGLDIPPEEERKQILKQFHQKVFTDNCGLLNGEAQVLHKMKPFWEHFSNHFQMERKVYKLIKKSVGINKYEKAVDFAFQQNLKD
ncbi:tRNA-dihydrouridine synthase family protein [Ancylomarina longa]|uniref:tRNA-dihydrouridine synthase n=1 Tax=Ancylomarina longa TaxID=2487017 RepID=A0A434AVR2_9BACT|nr:tRNA-dihydrouridine synthase family protein [Ancylomarina longa]RUT78540.1 tRNA-dihydrouridine synthase family protein [Ancylomarina longa]